MTGRFALDPGAYEALCLDVLDEDRYQCRVPWCRRDVGLQVHHILPRSAGGADDRENLVSLCLHCHADQHAGFLVILHRPGRAFRFVDLRRLVVCEGCHQEIRDGRKAVVPTPAGGLRVVSIGAPSPPP